MRLIAIFLLITVSSTYACEHPLLDYSFKKLASNDAVNLCETYNDNVILVVNTASKCGNTPQYDGLEKLYQEYSDQGLVVLGFPSNNFFGQEPGTEEQIQEFCRLTYGVQFPMFEKINVKGRDAHPFFVALKEASGRYPTWNFHKYLIGRDGELISAIGARTQPYDPAVIQQIETALSK